MKKYIKPDISLLYFEAERITTGDGDDTTAVASQNLFAPDKEVTVTDSVSFAKIKDLN